MPTDRGVDCASSGELRLAAGVQIQAVRKRYNSRRKKSLHLLVERRENPGKKKTSADIKK